MDRKVVAIADNEEDLDKLKSLIDVDILRDKVVLLCPKEGGELLGALKYQQPVALLATSGAFLRFLKTSLQEIRTLNPLLTVLVVCLEKLKKEEEDKHQDKGDQGDDYEDEDGDGEDVLREISPSEVDDLLLPPVSRRSVSQKLVMALHRAERLQNLLHSNSQNLHGEPFLPKPKVISVIGSRGGCGVSLFSSYLAHLVSRELKDQSVLMADFDVEEGDLRMIFGGQEALRARGYGELIDVVDELDKDMIGRVIHKVGDLNLLFSPSQEQLLDSLDLHFFQSLLNCLRDSFRVLLLILSANLGMPSTRVALSASDHVLVITEPRPFAIRGLQRLLALLAKLVPEADLRVILNKFDSVQALPTPLVEKAIGRSIYRKIPEDAALGLLFEQTGTLLLERRDLSVVASIYEICSDLFLVGDFKGGETGRSIGKELMSLWRLASNFLFGK
ncbi:hypothetical protein HKBW3S43_00153 [Candidatus Hakubella thermalkaliphila]|uniref:AAA domain-containing protein n=2 Tax=Candidatus Hakubella thermalkaliphila TaxID=2754717 RepID=A0A6V8PP22_9ACTN|nr:AAA family ATPase [Candidatus Hakubella thermalkaliphila]GFP34359.1 hypothetical protein HKBW3S43_00153 [Candidatus Hakubella thermalkaliphila]